MSRSGTKSLLSTFWVVIVFIIAVIGVGLIGVWWIVHRWLLIASLTIILLVVMGFQTNGRAAGALIDPRFKMSLSRFQIGLWTILVASAFLTVVLERLNPAVFTYGVSSTVQDALNVLFPPELLAALGISAASYAVAGLVKSGKGSKKIDIELQNKRLDEAERAEQAAQGELDVQGAEYQELLGELVRLSRKRDDAKEKLASAAEAERKEAERAYVRLEAAVRSKDRECKQAEAAKTALEEALAKAKENHEDLQRAESDRAGLLHRNSDPSEAAWVDMFRGEEIGNYLVIDMAKVQMFLFTIAVVFTYLVALYGVMNDDAALAAAPFEFPSFSSSLIALLGISHAGYLSIKAVDQTKVEK